MSHPFQRRAENLFRGAFRVDIGRIEKVDAGLEANADESSRIGDVRGAPGTKKVAAATERRRAETEYRQVQTATAESSSLHGSC